MGSRGIT